MAVTQHGGGYPGGCTLWPGGLRLTKSEMPVNTVDRAGERLDPPAASLVFSNLFAIVVALFGKWSLADLPRVYRGQSVVIGYRNSKPIRLLNDFSTENLRMNGWPLEPTPA